MVSLATVEYEELASQIASQMLMEYPFIKFSHNIELNYLLSQVLHIIKAYFPYKK